MHHWRNSQSAWPTHLVGSQQVAIGKKGHLGSFAKLPQAQFSWQPVSVHSKAALTCLQIQHKLPPTTCNFLSSIRYPLSDQRPGWNWPSRKHFPKETRNNIHRRQIQTTSKQYLVSPTRHTQRVVSTGPIAHLFEIPLRGQPRTSTHTLWA